MKQTYILIVLLFFLFISCSEKEKENSKKQKISLFKKKTGPNHIDSLLTEQFISSNPEFESERNKIHEFYSRRNYKLVWSKDEEFLPQTNMFINILNNIKSRKAKVNNYKDYQLKKIYKEISETQKPHGEKISALRKNIDMLLTAYFLKYSNHIWKENINYKHAEIEWYVGKKKIRFGKTLNAILANTENDSSIYEPLHDEYGKLKSLLETYRNIYNQGGWPIINIEKKLHKGDHDNQIPLLRKRLYLSGDLDKISDNHDFDTDVENAIKHFQRRHGLIENGRIDKGTVRTLNIPVEERIRQIIINMERWRWVPEKASDNYIMINIPEFKMHVFEGEKEIWDMKVIVGRASLSTPVFNDEIEYIVTSPIWNIPDNIAIDEVVPLQRKDSTFFSRENIKVFKDTTLINPSTINWDTISEDNIHQLKIRQLPGDKNALGYIKFIFPNDYDVYLHGTPKEHLFGRTKRAYSHGCIRLEDPLKFAEYLLKDDPLWTEKKIVEAMHSGKEQFIKLNKKIPVYIVYFTAWVDEEGLANFREDIYGHDEKLAEVFFAQ